MSTSDYIPINKKRYVNKVIALEAENLALKKKLKVYEELLLKKVKNNLKYTTNQKIKDPFQEMQNIPNEFKQNISKFLENPTQNSELLQPLISQMITKQNKPPISGEVINEFLNNF